MHAEMRDPATPEPESTTPAPAGGGHGLLEQVAGAVVGGLASAAVTAAVSRATPGGGRPTPKAGADAEG